VEHIAGEKNVMADALSRYENERVLQLLPGVEIFHFEPPRDALGEVKK